MTDLLAVQTRLLSTTDVRTIVDVGAYVGDTPLAYAEAFPSATVHAIEADPDTFDQLERFTAAHPRIVRHRVAIGDADGVATFHRTGYPPAHSLLPRPSTGKRYYPSDAGPAGTIVVPIQTLDAFCREQRIDNIDLLKLDIQGGEGAALAGACSLLSAAAVRVICAEVAFVRHYESAPLFADIAAILAGFGYTLFDLVPHLHGSDGQLRYADAIFFSAPFRREEVDRLPAEP